MKYYNLETCLERLAASICKEAEDKSSGGGDELAFGEGNPNDGPVPSAITPLTTKSIQPSPDRSHTTCSQDMEKRELSQCSKEYNGSHSGGAEREGAKSPQMPAQDACSKHRRTVQERYGATFVAFGCICKAMLARGLDTCCTVQSQHSRSSSLRSNTPIPQSGRAKREPIYSLAAPSQNPSNTSLRKGSDGCCLDTTKVQKISGRPSLRGIPMLLDIAKAAHRRIIFNFAWSFIYNVFAILLAGGAFVRARIPPAYAGLGEVVSVLPVVIIALQLKWAQFSDNQ